MALAGIDVRVAATSNMTQVQRDLKKLETGMRAAANAQTRIAQDLARQGSGFDMGAMDKHIGAVETMRSQIRKATVASGQYNVTTRNLTTTTAAFNERLARQKLNFSDIWGPRNMRIMRASMKEQMAMQNMIVQGYRRSGDRIDADIFTPSAASMQGVRAFRKELGYFAQVGSAVALSVTNWGKNIQWAGRQLTVGFSVPLSLALGGLSRLGYALDESLVRVTKVYGDNESAAQLSNENIRKMATDTAKHVAEQWGLAGQATLDIMGELAATGLKGPDLQSMTVQTQRASLLGDLSQQESLKLLRTLREAYRQNNDELENSVNLFNEIENSTALTMNDIAEGLPRIAGIMQSTGVSMEDTLVLLTGFKEAGIDVAEGANALKSINFKAIAATPTAARNFLEITGQDITQIVENAGGDFMTVMLEIANIMQDLDQVSRNNLIARVFGVHQGSRAITILEQLANGSQGMQRAMDAAGKSSEDLAKTAAEELKDLEESASTRFNRVKESVILTFGEMGRMALEKLLPLIEGIGSFINWLGSLPDWIKSSGIYAAITLAIIGPLVMLVGLFANLIGTMGRSALAIVKLIAPFKVLNLESTAARKLQEAFGSSLDKNTSAIMRQAAAMDGLAAKYASIVQAAFPPAPTLDPRMNVDAGGRWRQGGRFAPAPAQYIQYQQTGGTMNPAAWLAAERGAASATKEVGKLTDATGKSEVATRRFQSGWMRASATMSVAAGSVMMLGNMVGNQLVSNIAMGVMAFSGLLPVAGTLIKTIDTRLTQAVASSTGRMAALATAAGTHLKMFGNTIKSIAGMLVGPWGLALAAATAGGIYLWKKFTEDARQAKKTMEDVLNTRGQLGDALGYTPRETYVEELRQESGWDEGSILAHRARINQYREDEADILKTMLGYEELISKEYDGQLRRQKLLNEAMRLGQEVLADTGSTESAQHMAWDMYGAMTGETMTLDSFKELQVSFGWDHNSFTNVQRSFDESWADFEAYFDKNNDLYAEVEIDADLEAMARELAAQQGSDDWKEFLPPVPIQLQLDPVTLGEIEKTVQNMMLSLDSPGINTFTQNRLMESTMGDMFDMWRVEYETFQQITGDTEMSFLDFARTIQDHDLSIMDADQVAMLQMLLPELIRRFGDANVEYIGQNEHATEVMSGLRSEIMSKVTEQEKEEIKLKHLAGLESANIVTRQLAIAAYREEIDALGRSRIAKDYMEQSATRLGAGIQALSGNVDGLGDELEDTEDQMKGLVDAMVAGRKAASEWATNEALDDLWKQFDAEQQEQRDAQDAINQQAIDDINAAYDKEGEILQAGHQKALDALADREKRAGEALDKDFDDESKALDKRHQLQNQAIDDQAAAATKALEEAHKIAQKALDKRLREEQKAQDRMLRDEQRALRKQQKDENKAFTERWRQIDKDAKKRQDDRRQEVEDAYQARVDAVNDLIEAEREAERRRQEIFAAEQERVKRMSEMFGRNIDFNMAINTGDMDQAARIANQMAAQTHQWGLDDAAEVSMTASEKRIKELEESIDLIEEEKQARLDALKEIEEAEDEARRKRQEREKEELDILHEQQSDALADRHEQLKEALREEHQIRKDALREQQEMEKQAIRDQAEADKARLKDAHDREKQALADSQALRREDQAQKFEDEKKHLDDTLKANEDSLADRRESAVKEQEKENEEISELLDEQLDAVKKGLELQVEAYIAKAPPTLEGEKQLHEDLEVAFSDHMQNEAKVSEDTAEYIADKRKWIAERTINEFESERKWEEMAENIAKRMIGAVVGSEMTTKEMQEFIEHGKFPKRGGRTNDWRHEARHQGGIVGSGMGSRAGFSGKGLSFSEKQITALKGEGVLNLKAMSIPGMQEFLHGANQGRINYAPGTGDGPGMMEGVTLAIANRLQKRMTEMMTLRGLERGIALNNFSGGMHPDTYEGAASILDSSQIANARKIIQVGRSMSGISERDILIGIMTAMQESSLRNINHGDRDSLGLFQQRPSQGWGSPSQIMDPNYSIAKFFSELIKINDRNNMPLWEAAQKVQRSAHPYEYAKHESLGRDILGQAHLDLSELNNLGFDNRFSQARKAMEEIIAREDYSLDGIPPAGGRFSGTGPGWQRMWEIISNQIPHAVFSSGYRNRVRTASGFRSYHNAGRALDIVSTLGKSGMMEIFEWIRKQYGAKNHELYYSPAEHRQIRQGMPHRPTGVTRNNHFDHVHWAMKNGGTVPGVGYGDIAPAMLEPREYVVNRKASDTYRPLLEAINSSDGRLPRGTGIDNGGNSTYNVKVEFTGPVNSDIDVERVVKRVFKKVESRKGGRRKL